jgi:hypothetical protein
MALSPMAIAALIGAAGEAPQTIGTLMPTALDIANRKRREELERRAAAGALGLTEEEMGVQRAAVERELAATERALRDQRQRALAGAGAGSGEALKVALQSEQQQMEQRQRMAEVLQAQDVAEKQAELDELDQLVAEQARRQFERRAALAAPNKSAAEAATDLTGFLRTTGQDAGVADTEAKKQASLQLIKDTYGLDDEKAEAAYAMFLEDLELLE